MFIDFHRVFSFHHFVKCATDLIAHFFAPLDCFDISLKYPPPINMRVVSSSRLAKDAKKCTLKLVQLRILGLTEVIFPFA
jgi:hypothetical protein